MIYYIRVYDDKKLDIESTEFKEKIAEGFKEAIIRDWDNLVKIENYEETNRDKNNQIEYNTTIALKIEYPESECPK